MGPTLLAIDPVALLRLRTRVFDVAEELRRHAGRLLTLDGGGDGSLHDAGWRLQATAARLSAAGEDLGTRVARLAAAPGVGGPGASVRSRMFDAVTSAGGAVLDGTGAYDAVDDLRDVRRSTDVLRRTPAIGELPGAYPGRGGTLTVAEEVDRFGRASHVVGEALDVIKPLGAAAGAFGALGDVHTLIDPPHDGWYGVADRAAAVAGLTSATALTASAFGLIALTPVGMTAVAVLGGAAAVYGLGSLVVDHHEQIADVADHAVDGLVQQLGGWFRPAVADR